MGLISHEVASPFSGLGRTDLARESQERAAEGRIRGAAPGLGEQFARRIPNSACARSLLHHDVPLRIAAKPRFLERP